MLGVCETVESKTTVRAVVLVFIFIAFDKFGFGRIPHVRYKLYTSIPAESMMILWMRLVIIFH